MRFVDIYSDIENTSQVTGERAFIKRAVQRTLDRIGSYDRWEFYLTSGFVTTVAPYETGTVSATNGSKTITGSGTTFTSAMVGRKIRVSSDTTYYVIASFTSTTSIELEQAYQGTTASGSTYSIFQDEYYLNADVDWRQYFRQVQTGRRLEELSPVDFDSFYPAPNAEGDPYVVIPLGRAQKTYTTGTVTGTSAASVITGSSTDWLNALGVSRGTRIKVGTLTYTVKSVDSATQVTIYGTLSASFSASAYTMVIDNQIVQFYPIPDAARNIYYRYGRKAAEILSDSDEPDLPPENQWMLVRGGLIEAWSHKGDEERAQSAWAELKQGLNEMRLHRMPATRLYRRYPQSMNTMIRRPRYPGTFDVSVSA